MSVNNAFDQSEAHVVITTHLRPQQVVINSCAGDNSKSEPPDPFPNSEVKPLSADGSVGLPM